MSDKQNKQDLHTLKRSNSELKHAVRHFIDCAPISGSFAVQINTIKDALKSNDAMFTFASLVEQYSKMKQNFDHVEYKSKQKDLNTLKSLMKKSIKKNLASNHAEKIDDILSAITLEQPMNTIMVELGKALEYFSEDLALLREHSKVIVSNKELTSEETGVVASDIHIASKRLLKDVVIIAKKLIKTYPNDEFIHNILHEAAQVSDKKGIFFKSINLLERSATYLALLINQERSATEEMLNDIQANIVDVFKQTTVIQELMTVNQKSTNSINDNLVIELKNMEVKANEIDTLAGIQQHIKNSVALMANIINDYSDKQNEIHSTNQATIEILSAKVQNTSNFVEKLEKKLDIAEESNLVDELTTIGNRKGYVQAINKERKVWATSKLPLTLMVIDVDKFKPINDDYGHNIGDQVLKCLGQTLQKHIRSTDYVARYGGEEFIIVLPATDINKTAVIAKKIKEIINGLKFEIRKQNKVLKITCSYGIATFTEQVCNTTDVFIAADKALYKAKESGRNAIFAYHEEQYIHVDKQKELQK